MPTRTGARLTHPRHVVTAVLVVRDGAEWLPDVLAALRRQVRPPQRVVAVDLSSADEGPDLVAAALGPRAVLTADRDTTFGAAVATAVAATAGAPLPPSARRGDGEPVEWLWLLHDDSAPEPRALAELVELVDGAPSVGVAGPKLLAMDGSVLLEVGRSTDRAGRLDVGVDADEVDQGQHDVVRDVLAVGSAGALVRRDLWLELGGFDPALPMFRDDLDFGWRANLTGRRVLVVPGAVVRHAAAASHGRRPAPGGGRPRRLDRAAAAYVLLANLPALSLPPTAARLAAGALARAGYFAVAVGVRPAVDELAAVGSVLGRPHRVARARRARRAARRLPPAVARPLLVGAAARLRARAERVGTAWSGRGSAATVRGSHRPGGWGARVSTLSLMTVALLLATLVAERGLFGVRLAGGRLLPVPGGASDLWRLFWSAWHDVGPGTSAPAPPYLAVVAGLATVLLGKPWLAVDILLLLAPVLAGWAAYHAAVPLTRSRRVRAWVGAAYGLGPVLTGAVTGGRLDACLAAVTVPLLVRAGWGLLSAPGGGRRVAARVALLLTVAAAFSPLLYPMTLLALAAAVVGSGRRPGLPALALVAGVPLLLLWPWTATVLTHPGVLLAGIGAGTGADTTPAAAALVALNPGGVGTPPDWLLAGVPVAAFAATLRAQRVRAAACWAGGLLGLAAALLVTRRPVTVPDGSRGVAWAGAATAVTAAALLAAAVLAATGARRRLAARSFGWRQPAAVLLALVTLPVPLVAGALWAVTGAGGTLRPATSPVPAFVAAEMTGPGGGRLLLLRGGAPVRYTLTADPGGPTLGAADLPVAPAAAARLHRLAAALVAGTGTDLGPSLRAQRVRFVQVTGPGAAGLAAAVDRVPGLTRLSGTGALVWRSSGPLAPRPVVAGTGRHLVLVGQLVLLAAVLVAAAPARRSPPW